MSHLTTTSLLCWIVISTTLGAACVQAAEAPPFAPFEATYSVQRGNSEIGEMQAELLRRDDGLWHFSMASEATAWYARMLGISTTESAWFQWFENEVLPLTYHHVSRKPGSDRFWQHRYDWQDMQTDTSTHEGDLIIALTSGVVDPLTLRLEAVARLAEQAPDFESFELSVLERDEIETQQYRHIDKETLKIGDRCFHTAVFKRFRKTGSSRNYTAWHAESLGWMPVRIRHEDDGKPITLTLVDWNSREFSMPTPGMCAGHRETK